MKPSDYLLFVDIDERIINNLKERNLPLNNLYWKGQTSFLSAPFSFLFIAIWFDLLLKSNKIEIDKMLSDTNLLILEKMLHFSALEESKFITTDECFLLCKNIDIIKEKLIKNPLSFNLLENLTTNFPVYTSLRRSNFSYLYFILFNSDKDLNKLNNDIELFSSAVTCACIFDDLYDFKSDFVENELNIINELGG